MLYACECGMIGELSMDGFVKVRLMSLLKRTVAIPERKAQFGIKDKVLIMAPHFDDDVLSCFGAMWEHKERDATIDILYITDGSACQKSGLIGEEIIKTRELEAKNSLLFLGENVTLHKLKKKDGNVHFDVEDIDWLCRLLEKQNYQYIYAPHISDTHPDHKETFSYLVKAIKKSNILCKIRFYEFWMPLKKTNVFVDISEIAAQKEAAILCHESQLRFINYAEIVQVLNSYRGKQLGLNACEAYWEIQSVQLDDEEI